MPGRDPLFQAMVEHLVARVEPVAAEIATLPVAWQVEALNRIRQVLHQAGPFAGEPVDCVLWVAGEAVAPNDYNPNRVAPPEMRLLRHSIEADGYTQPVVGFAAGAEGATLESGATVEVVDGFHRTRVGKETRAIRERLHGYLPVALINPARGERKDRVAATIRHNRARGVHGVSPMSEIVADLLRRGWSDEEVAKELGMDADEVLRFKHHAGLPELFKGQAYSRAWE
jgi:ParB-like chromosome segregation protein Spo0J